MKPNIAVEEESITSNALSVMAHSIRVVLNLKHANGDRAGKIPLLGCLEIPHVIINYYIERNMVIDL